MPRRLLVTSALPYINAPIHIGHMVEHIQTDIWVRFQRLRGHEVLHLCAADTHGTATMIRARKEKRREQDIIEEVRRSHVEDFGGFGVRFDHYSSTDSESNRRLSEEMWAAVRAKGRVVEREVTQLFDVQEGSFLADRFVKGTCPKCGTANQNGDNCEKCASTYAATDLIDPISVLSGTRPELRQAKHYFVTLEPSHDFLARWTQSGVMHPDMAKWVTNTFLADTLRDWDVSRPAPYFGFEIPDAPGNFFYVWWDAPIGYIATTLEWCQAHGQRLERWWKDAGAEIHHFIGKDITYFHTLFWPAVLDATGYALPRFVHIHGFLTVNSEKMSKSTGTSIKARTYLDLLEPGYLRYYYASKLGPSADDLDLNLGEFVAKVNSDLVGKVVNLASRTARFVPRLASSYPDDGGLFRALAAESEAIAANYEEGDFNQAMRRIMALADRANEWVSKAEPWKLQKDPGKAEQLTGICTVALNLFRQLAVYLTPVLPRLSEQAGALLAAPIRHWDDAQAPVLGNAIAPWEQMMDRLEQSRVDALIERSKETGAEPAAAAAAQGAGAAQPPAPGQRPPARIRTPLTVPANEVELTGPAGEVELTVPADEIETESDSPQLREEPIQPRIAFPEFQKVDLRVAEVIAAEEVPKARKIIKLVLSLGGSERRTVFAGIKSAYKPEQLVGRLIVFVANLEPRTMSFGVSEGMALAAGMGEQEIFLLSPDSGAKAGQRVR